jgi:Uma2 family endonuclease
MRTVVLGRRPAELEALIARRRALGQDRHDEVWGGEYHMAPASHGYHGVLIAQLAMVLGRPAAPRGLVVGTEFNLGNDEHNFRVPDLGLHRGSLDAVWFDTAAMVVEVVSPDDESWLKFDHYAAHGVDEVLIADPRERTLHLFVLGDGRYESAHCSALLDVELADLHAAIDWPGSE